MYVFKKLTITKKATIGKFFQSWSFKKHFLTAINHIRTIDRFNFQKDTNVAKTTKLRTICRRILLFALKQYPAKLNGGFRRYFQNECQI